MARQIFADQIGSFPAFCGVQTRHAGVVEAVALGVEGVVVAHGTEEGEGAGLWEGQRMSRRCR